MNNPKSLKSLRRKSIKCKATCTTSKRLNIRQTSTKGMPNKMMYNRIKRLKIPQKVKILKRFLKLKEGK